MQAQKTVDHALSMDPGRRRMLKATEPLCPYYIRINASRDRDIGGDNASNSPASLSRLLTQTLCVSGKEETKENVVKKEPGRREGFPTSTTQGSHTTQRT